MCKAHSKVITKYFHTSSALDIIQSSYYIHGPLGAKNIFAVLYVSLCYGLTRCYKTTVFFTFIFAVFLLNAVGHFYGKAVNSSG